MTGLEVFGVLTYSLTALALAFALGYDSGRRSNRS